MQAKLDIKKGTPKEMPAFLSTSQYFAIIIYLYF